jgi:hypothetical protein
MKGEQTPDKDDVWTRRIALTESNGRRVNEAIQRGRRERGHAVFVCECGRIGCSTTLRLTLDEYEKVRTSFDRFLLTDGHETLEIEDVVERHAEYIVVRKRGPGAEVAEVTDPRGDAP